MSNLQHQPYQVIIPAAGTSQRLKSLTRDAPKSLLEVGGQAIIRHSLDVLDATGLHDVVLIVGYQHERLREALSDRYKNIRIAYAHSQDYASTEHGWSVYQARQLWQPTSKPVILMDADNLYDPRMLQRLLLTDADNVCLIDADYRALDRVEELVTGDAQVVRQFVRGLSADHPDCVGGFVGINKFSSAFMSDLFDFMQVLFESEGKRFKYERVLDRFVATGQHYVCYESVDGLAWININHETDLTYGETVAKSMLEFVGDGQMRAAN